MPSAQRAYSATRGCSNPEGVQKRGNASRRCSRGTTLFPFRVNRGRKKNKGDNAELTWPRHHVRPVQLPVLAPQTRSGTPRRRVADLALATLEESHELFERAGEILRAGYLSGWLLRLQEAIERGDERAGDVVALQAHERARVRIGSRREERLSRRTSTVREAV